MEYEINGWFALLLISTGIIAGFINILAGGGSFLTIPALMLMGIPADIANATNRVGVMLQATEGIRGFNKKGMLDKQAIVPILLPTIVGSCIGALLASYVPVSLLKPIILITLISMALLMVIKPSIMTPPEGTEPLSPWQSPGGFIGLFLAGIYGGFIQAGVGFALLAALVGTLRYDLVRANALKMVATAIFTIVSLIIFISRDQILWVPGLLLAVGSVIGARLSVNFAVTVSQPVLRWFLLVTVIAVCIGVTLKT